MAKRMVRSKDFPKVHYLAIDTCVWLDFIKTDFESLDKMISLVESDKLKLLLPTIVRTEWSANKNACLSRAVKSVKDKSKNALEVLPDLDLESQKKLRDGSQRMEARLIKWANDSIEKIDNLFSHKNVLSIEPSDRCKLTAVDLAMNKRAPFRVKNSMADALIFLSVVEYVAEKDIPECSFVTTNKSDFSSENSGDAENLHSDLRQFVTKQKLPYFINIGKAINHIEAHLISDAEIARIEEDVTKQELIGVDTYFQEVLSHQDSIANLIETAKQLHSYAASAVQAFEKSSGVWAIQEAAKSLNGISQIVLEQSSLINMTTATLEAYRLANAETLEPFRAVMVRTQEEVQVLVDAAASMRNLLSGIQSSMGLADLAQSIAENQNKLLAATRHLTGTFIQYGQPNQQKDDLLLENDAKSQINPPAQ